MKRAAWLLVPLIVIALGTFGWRASDPGADLTPHQASLDALAALGDTPPPDPEALDRFRALFASLQPETIADQVRAVYAPVLFFNDTVHTLHDVEALAAYMQHTAESVEACEVTFHDVAIAGANVYVRWTMEIRFKAFKAGESTRSSGMTHLRFDATGKVIYHQDYWDVASGIYEHVPLLGRAIRLVKGRMASGSGTQPGTSP